MIKKEHGVFVVITSSIIFQTVTNPMEWLETDSASKVCILRDSESMLKKVKVRCVSQWLESVLR